MLLTKSTDRWAIFFKLLAVPSAGRSQGGTAGTSPRTAVKPIAQPDVRPAVPFFQNAVFREKCCATRSLPSPREKICGGWKGARLGFLKTSIFTFLQIEKSTHFCKKQINYFAAERIQPRQKNENDFFPQIKAPAARGRAEAPSDFARPEHPF